MNFATLQGLTIPEGVVTQIADASGRLLWALSGGKVVLEVEKITDDTNVGGISYTGERFILLDIYPKPNGTVNVTYGGLTKTVTDTSGVEEPNAIEVFFGTYGGVSDEVETPANGTLTIEGDCRGFAIGYYNRTKTNTAYWTGITAVKDFGNVEVIPDYAFGGIGDYESGGATYPISFGCGKITTLQIPDSITSIGHGAFYNCQGLASVIMLSTTPPTLASDAFSGNVLANFIITVPKGCGEAYKAANGWSEYADYIVEAS